MKLGFRVHLVAILLHGLRSLPSDCWEAVREALPDQDQRITGPSLAIVPFG